MGSFLQIVFKIVLVTIFDDFWKLRGHFALPLGSLGRPWGTLGRAWATLGRHRADFGRLFDDPKRHRKNDDFSTGPKIDKIRPGPEATGRVGVRVVLAPHSCTAPYFALYFALYLHFSSSKSSFGCKLPAQDQF